MVTTIVLAVCDIHQIPETAQAIADLPDVSEVYSVAG
ncbi:MAG: Lrp/AsnC family transcriptional regulator, partial [Actinomycetota bacterium]